MNEQSKVLKATYTVEDFQRLYVAKEIKLKSTKPFYKGKARTVKQRNKARWNNRMIKVHNDRVLRFREMKRLEKGWISDIGKEMRKAIDDEILTALLGVVNPVLLDIETERQWNNHV